MSLGRRSGEMVQPGGVPVGTGSSGGGGEGGGGTGGPEVAAAAGEGAEGPLLAEGGSGELLQRLLLENRELKAALRRSNDGLRGRLEELRRLQGLRRAERESQRGRAAQARALVERLRGERDEATRRLRDQGPESLPSSSQDPSSDPPEPSGGANDAHPDLSSPEQLRQRLAATESLLAAAEQRAEEVTQRAELQLQGLRRQLEQDKAQVQAQVTSLLGELQESQSRLESCRRDRDRLHDRAQVATARCRALEEAQGGHSLQLDQLRLQVQNLEAALRVERQGATEEKRKLVQLQVAYHHLFQEYDAHIKATLDTNKQGQELSEARRRLQEAEEALAAKQELIDHLKGEAERHRAALDTLPVLQAQAEIYRADFEAERAAREQLHAQREELQEALERLRLRLEGEGGSRSCLEELRHRHSELGPPPAPSGFGGAPPEEGPDLCCPKCQYKAPDLDTLQIHVMDCIKKEENPGDS